MTLFYQLSENEWTELDMARGQLSLMADVTAQCGKGVVSVADLHSFLESVHDKVCAVTASVEKRDVQRKGVPPEILTNILRMAAGEDLDTESMQDVNKQLLQAMQEEPAFAAALRPFYILLTQRGYKVDFVEAKPVQARARRSRAKLVAEGAAA